METTFVVSRFLDIRKETTSFLVVPKKTDQEQRSFSVRSDNYMTRNDQERPETNQLNERENLSALSTSIDILLSRVGEFTLIEFKGNSHCFYEMKYWRNC